MGEADHGDGVRGCRQGSGVMQEREHANAIPLVGRVVRSWDDEATKTAVVLPRIVWVSMSCASI
jgi:hypothetical protein